MAMNMSVSTAVRGFIFKTKCLQAVKEFSKSRLRKRQRSNFLRRPHAAFRSVKSATGSGFNSPLHHNPMPGTGGDGPEGSLHLIKEEIAIMKQLHHPNLVSLIEVLDDPKEDSLYMVLEMCKKGVIMKVGLGERADPYDNESCRYWFRDMILGIEFRKSTAVHMARKLLTVNSPRARDCSPRYQTR